MNEHQFTEDNSHVFIPAANGSYRAVRRAEQHLNIQQIVTKEIGTWMKSPHTDTIEVWDGEVWLQVDRKVPVTLAILPHNTGERFNAEEIEWIKEVVLEREEEVERLKLRQLLAERQADGLG